MIKEEEYKGKYGTDMHYRYFDKNGVEITDGCTIRYESGNTEKVYATDSGELGTDATNHKWVETGRAFPCEYGIYPLTWSETNEVEVIDEQS